MTTRVLVLFVCAASVFGACGSNANAAHTDAIVGPIAVVGDMRPNLQPRVFTFDPPRVRNPRRDGGERQR